MIEVAIITPTLKSDDYLRRACECLRNNSNDNIRITHFIIFDNSCVTRPEISSTRHYDIVLCKNSGRNGPSAARNVGIRLLTDKFDYFGFLDADDYLSDTYICNSTNMLREQQSTVAFGQGVINNIDAELGGYSNVPIKDQKVTKNLILINIIGCPSGVLILNTKDNRNVFFDETLRYLEDYYYYLKLLIKENKFLKTSEIYRYQVHHGQSTASDNIVLLRDQIATLSSKLGVLELSAFENFLVKQRIKLSNARLGGRLRIETLLAFCILALICPQWIKGRLKMWKLGR